jgi:acyl-coenzyme A synthetase/AMP-(fatty) acid ligase
VVPSSVTQPAPSVADELLGGDEAAPALHHDGATVSYGELRRRVDERAAELSLDHRGVVVLAGSNTLELVVTYLATLRAGHVVLLGGDHADALAEAWAADVLATADRHDVRIEIREQAPRSLHPDLALLLSTSGSTGSPKLVRLSHENLLANARSIAQYLELGPPDCGITSLPLHYCYGLSILHSHLVVGASVALTDGSVVDAEFAATMRRHHVTSLAGVPHTFAMLDRAGPESVHVPSLRRLTQAGGRMDPTSVERWIDRAEQWGAAFVVMYGQTEATARMAYLPPEIGRRRPGAIGRAIPGGELALRPVEGQPDDVGELVYCGPNVMMGYATEMTDLAAPAVLDALATGDLARFHPDDGVFEIVGRRARFVKPFGLRVDLDRVEESLATTLGAAVAVTGDDDRLVVAAPGHDAERVRAMTVTATGVPAGRISVVASGEIPRTANGKVDYPALLRSTRPDCTRSGASVDDALAVSGDRRDTVTAIYRDVLGARAVGPTDSFLSLGGDSLSYVECAIRLEPIVGRLPADWHTRSVADLATVAGSTSRARVARVDATVVYRAVAICLVVATHMRLWFWPGGAHLLLAVVGFNLSRFLTPIEPTRTRVAAGLRTAARVAVPTVLWIAAGMVLAGAYSTGTLLLVNNYVGPPSHRDDHWTFWFIEVFVHLVLITTVLLAIPAVRRWERRWPYGFPLALLLGALLLRLEIFQMGDFYNMRFRTHGVAWFFLLGWLIQRSSTRNQKLLTTLLCVVTAPHFFGYVPREIFIATALVLLVWCREVTLPRWCVRPVGVVAAASMWIYITHFSFWPPLLEALPIGVAFVLTIAAGIVVWAAVERLEPVGRALWNRASARLGARRGRLVRIPLRAG